MDLISRKEAIEEFEDMVTSVSVYGESAEARYATNARIRFIEKLNNIPAVPAVPLDKLCVWLAKFGCPCEINEGMCDDAHGVDRCLGIFNSNAFCWQYWLTKMEEQDAAD